MKSLENKVKSQKSKVKSHTIAVLGSHSALEVCFGAKKLGFKTLVIVEKGRDRTYVDYFHSRHPGGPELAEGPIGSHDGDSIASLQNDIPYMGCVDEVLYVDQFKDLLTEKVQKVLKAKNCIFIPHRSFEVYLADYDAIEKSFDVPMFGNRFLLRAEERTESPNQYDILEKAGIKYPKRFKDASDIDRLALVKVLEKERAFERAFFLVSSYVEYQSVSRKLVKEEKITREALEKAVIEEFVIGVQVNFNFFYSPLHNRLELIGTDTRRQTNLDGILRLPQNYQAQLVEDKIVEPSYEEAGHIAVTVLESLLEQAFAVGERFVQATQEMFSPGVIGPFGLQSVIIAGPPKKEIVVFDISPRMPGSPGIAATPYSSYLYGRPVSMGERVAMEIKEAIERGQTKRILM